MTNLKQKHIILWEMNYKKKNQVIKNFIQEKKYKEEKKENSKDNFDFGIE